MKRQTGEVSSRRSGNGGVEPDAAEFAAEFAATDVAAPLCEQVEKALQRYFRQLDGHAAPSSLYRMVLREVEPPLLRTVLQYTGGNQSRAAEILGLDRSTLRKKLKQYSLN